MKRRDLCPSFPGIWIKGEVCAIVYENNDAGKIVNMNDGVRDAANGALRDFSFCGHILAKTLARNIEGGCDAAYLSFYPEWAFFGYEKEDGRHIKELRANDNPETIIDYGLLRTHLSVYREFPIVVDGDILRYARPDDIRKYIGEGFLSSVRHGGAPLVVLKKEDSHLLSSFRVSRYAYLRRVKEREYNITTSYGMSEAQTYGLFIETKGGVHFVADNNVPVSADSTDAMCDGYPDEMTEQEAAAYLGMKEYLLRALCRAREIPFAWNEDGAVVFKKEELARAREEGYIGTKGVAEMLRTPISVATTLLSIGAIPSVNDDRRPGEAYATKKAYVERFGKEHGKMYSKEEAAMEVGISMNELMNGCSAGLYPYRKEWKDKSNRVLFDEHDVSAIREKMREAELEEIGLISAAAVTNTKKDVLKILAYCNVIEHTGEGDGLRFRRKYIVPKMKELGGFVTLKEAILLADMRPHEFYTISKEKGFEYYSDGCITIYHRGDIEALRAEHVSHAERLYEDGSARPSPEKQLTCFPNEETRGGKVSGADTRRLASTSPSNGSEQPNAASSEFKDAPEKTSKLLSYKEAEAILKVNPNAIAALASKGHLDSKRIDGKVRFTEESVKKLLPIASGLIGTKDVGKMIGAGEPIVRALEHFGEIPSFVHTDDIILFRKKDVEEFCESGKKWARLCDVARIIHKKPFDARLLMKEKEVRNLRYKEVSIYEISNLFQCLGISKEAAIASQQTEQGYDQTSHEAVSPALEVPPSYAGLVEILTQRINKCEKEYRDLKENNTYMRALDILTNGEDAEGPLLTSLAEFCDAGRKAERAVGEAKRACRSLGDIDYYDMPLTVAITRETIGSAEKAVEDMRQSLGKLIEEVK